MRLIPVVLVGLIASALAGCGGSPPPQTAKDKEKVVVGVFTSATDCSASGKLDVAACNDLIHSAIEAHNTSAKTYASMRLCEAAEGAERCERTAATIFRPQLLAFVVTFSTPPTSQPLYANPDRNVLGFTTADKKMTLLALDEQLQFSEAARAVAEGKIGG
jgi:Protein of unknown function (DUF1190)